MVLILPALVAASAPLAALPFVQAAPQGSIEPIIARASFFGPMARRFLVDGETPSLTQRSPKAKRDGSYEPLPTSSLQEKKPVYHVNGTFDFQSISLGLMQEFIEKDLFDYGLAKFSDEEFAAAGLNGADRYLIKFMADQEVGHAAVLSSLLGDKAGKMCKYQYPFTDVKGFLDFCQKVTRFGESGVYGFLNQLQSRPSAQLLLQSIATEARQQMIFRQFSGAFPMPVWFETAITQSMQWTLLAPYLKSCPDSNPHLVWNIFPTLNVTNNPSLAQGNTKAAISTNSTSLTYPGREVFLTWEGPGKVAGPDGKYETSTRAKGPAKYAAWVAQYNVTYTDLYDVKDGCATTKQPKSTVLPEVPSDPQVNGTMFVALVDDNPHLTPYNLSIIDEHIVAGPVLYQAD